MFRPNIGGYGSRVFVRWMGAMKSDCKVCEVESVGGGTCGDMGDI